MKKKSLLILSLMFMLLVFNNNIVLANEVDKTVLNANKFGILTLLPPLVAIILSFVSKNVVFSLFVGGLTGALLLQFNSSNIPLSILNSFIMIVRNILNSLADPWNAGIILQCLTIGGLIGLITKMGGAKAIAESLAKRAKSPIAVQLITWVLGILVFFDDYANSLIVGPIMRPVADKMKISREKQAFIIDATAAPIAGIALISTWVGYEISQIKIGFSAIGQTANAYGVFVSTIPYRFYNILILAFIILSAFLLREYGPMYRAERNARMGIYNENLNKVNKIKDEMLPKENIKLNVWNAIIPILTLIVVAILAFYFNGRNAIMGGEDTQLINLVANNPLSFISIRECFGASDASIVLFEAALAASIVAIIMGMSQKIFTLNEAIDTFVEGTKTLLITGVILLLAWSLSSVIKELGTAHFLVRALDGKLPALIVPSLVFIIASVISFATGTSYGTMAILMPLVIPVANGVNSGDLRYMIICISAVLTGAIFGDHCSPISDTTILSSMGAGCNHIEHVKTQMTYALTVAVVTAVFGYIPVTLGIPVGVVLLIDIVIIAAIIRFVGKPVEVNEEEVNLESRPANS